MPSMLRKSRRSGNYALLVDYQNKTNFNSNKAMLVFADGTEKVVETAKDYKGNSNKLELGTIVTYKEDNGVYTLKPWLRPCYRYL